MRLAEHTANVDEAGKKFVEELNALLEKKSCSAKIADVKDGVSKITYERPGTKRSLVSLTIGRDVLIHIYGERINEYINDMMSLPAPILNSIKRGKACVALNTGICTKCVGGYEFTVGDMKYNKCRYENFRFRVNDRTAAHLMKMVMNEIK